MKKLCVLDERKICDHCGACNRCDLDPNKICDNCCKCISRATEDQNYLELNIAEYYANQKDWEIDPIFLSSDDELDDSEEMYDGAELEYEWIDPDLYAEWERRLSAYEREQTERYLHFTTLQAWGRGKRHERRGRFNHPPEA